MTSFSSSGLFKPVLKGATTSSYGGISVALGLQRSLEFRVHSQPSEMPTFKALLQPHRTDAIGLPAGGIATNHRTSARSRFIRESYRWKTVGSPSQDHLSCNPTASTPEEDPGIA